MAEKTGGASVPPGIGAYHHIKIHVMRIIRERADMVGLEFQLRASGDDGDGMVGDGIIGNIHVFVKEISVDRLPVFFKKLNKVGRIF